MGMPMDAQEPLIRAGQLRNMPVSPLLPTILELPALKQLLWSIFTEAGVHKRMGFMRQAALLF